MKSEEFDFTASLKELEEITAWFESEEVDLNEALAKFERGMQLAADLKDHLQLIENRVEKIKRKFDGELITPPIPPDEPETPPGLFAE